MILQTLAIAAVCLCGETPERANDFCWENDRTGFRPPAVPLAVNDPYLSLWSPADRLTDAETMHWSRDAQPLSVVGEVNGRTWRFCGVEPRDVPSAKQLSVSVRCCETVYEFDADGARVELRFSTPFVPGEEEAFARPVTYLTVKGAKAKVTVSPAFATDDDAAEMVTNRTTVAGRPAVSIGRKIPKFLESGDMVRPNGGNVWLVDAGETFLLAFDAVKDMTFLSREAKAWWRRDGKSFETMLAEALRDAPRLMRVMAAFDAQQAKTFERVGGKAYARLAELAWRQSLGGGKLIASPDGEMLYFSKENTSNGCTATVDILYPQLPHLMLMGPAMMKAAMLPDLLYAVSDGWPFDYAPHDLGRFPCADRQRYGMWKGEDGALPPDADRMPVEESGNMILGLYALARLEGNADFAGRFWPTVVKWAAYLERTGFDPENQLCTDDFAGHLAHNANLSVKSILAFEAFARLAEMRGEDAVAAKYRALAAESVPKWVAASGAAEGASRLAFDATGTWSSKYNLAFGRAVGLDLFPEDVARREVATYLAKRDRYGTPLDSRTHWAKVDWLVWIATLAERRADFEALVAPVVAFLNETNDRVPFADLYYTETARVFRFMRDGAEVVGMNSRPVIGGVYLPVARASAGVVVLENARFRLTVGADATVRSLVVKATGEECAAAPGEIPLFSVTQERLFDDELKLIHANRRRAFAAKSLTREGNLLKVGFEIVPYVATVEVKETDAYVELKLLGFSTNYYDHCHLRLDKPPAVQFRVVQLPVKDRTNFGHWLNASWDARAAIGVVSTSPQPDIDNERRPGYRILTADLVKGRRFRGGSAAIVVANGREDFLDCMDRLETDFDLPCGVRSRRSGHLNGSIYHGLGTMGPSNIDQHIAWAKKGGFRYMCLPTEVMVKSDGEWGFHGDYDWRDDFPDREAGLRAMLAKIKAAGIIPGLHFLTPHVGLKSRYVTPVADRRLNVTRRFTLVKPLSADAGANEPFELVVQEPTEDSPRADGIRILKFGGELFSYEDYATEPPYRFLGVRRGAHKTNVVAHPAGEVGGVLDVCEYGTPTSCYADQNSDLPEEIGAKIANFYDCGFEFAYFDGAEGVNVPCGYHISNAQYRQYRQFGRTPLFCEGATKSHFGWHMLSGANAFDCFLPGEFKRMTAKFPFGQAPLTWQDMTRCNFGWWFFWKPNKEAKPELASGTQMDIWEYGQALSFAWDCPTTVLMDERLVAAHPRADDILETMRRWEDARVKQPFTAEEKESLKDASQEHHLYLNETGGYELVKSEMLPAPEKAPSVRGFLFERNGRRVLAFWHESGSQDVEFDLGEGLRRETVANLRYRETSLSRAEAKSAYARMKAVGE